MAIISRILLLAAAVPFVLATGSKSCKSNEFYFSQRDCCITRGPPPSPPAPPKDTQCPTNGWSWHPGQGCCVPHAPPAQQPPPTCNGGWTWDQSGLKCNPNNPRGYPPAPSKPSTPAVPEKPTTPSTPQKPTTPAIPSKPTTPATPSKPSGNCDDGHFYFGQKDCCLPHGGPPSPPSPPKGNQCPPSGWNWHTGKGCCVPNHPPSQMPPPQCPKGWDWNSNDLKCYPTPPTTTPPPSKPSNTPGKPGHGNYKRHAKSRSVNLCPSGLQACALKGLSGLTGDYECVDIATELTSCGGCASTGAGQDCTAIEGAWNVGCDQGACKVYTCAQGYRLSLDGRSCIKL